MTFLIPFQRKLQAPLAIKQEIPHQLRPILSKPFIQWIVAHDLKSVPYDVEEVVEVRFVLVVVQFLSGFFQFGVLGVAEWFEDESRF
jgi:hypothetical protein